MPAILHLNLHREFFAQIAAGTKHIEYRDRTPYWRRRLEGRHYDVIQFRNGYAAKAPVMQGAGKQIDTSPRPSPRARRRGCGEGRNACHAIRLGRILSTKCWQKTKSSQLKVG
jgi:hypothetical protein